MCRPDAKDSMPPPKSTRKVVKKTRATAKKTTRKAAKRTMSPAPRRRPSPKGARCQRPWIAISPW